jgi:hypothetical protein
VDGDKLVSITSFENEEFIFPSVHHAFKFCILATSGEAIPTKAEYSFFIRRIEQLHEAERKFSLSAEEIARINPNTKTAPTFRARMDAELTRKIYTRIPVLLNESGGRAGNPWGISFRQGLFNMTSDSSLFRTAKQLHEEGYRQEGTDWIIPVRQPALLNMTHPEDLDPYDGSSTQPEHYVPLYEAKMIHQFDHRWATFDGIETRDVAEHEKREFSFETTPRYWVPEREVRDRLTTKGWSHDWLMGWRDITNSTNERTVVAAACPLAGYGDTLLLMLPETSQNEFNSCLLGNLGSLVLDYTTRQKIGGTHLKYNVFKQIAVLPPAAYNGEAARFISCRVLELTYTSHSIAGFAHDLSYDGSPFAWDEDRRAFLRAELDAWFAHAYGLTRDELRYILDPADVMGQDYPSKTFHVLKDKEIKLYGEYRTRRLVLDAWDRMERGELPAPDAYDQRTAAAQQLANTGKDYPAVNPLFGAGPLFDHSDGSRS